MVQGAYRPVSQRAIGMTGRGETKRVRRVVTDPLRHGLGPLLSRCLPAGSAGMPRLLRSKYKPGRKLTAYYSLPLGGEHGHRHLAVTWSASPLDPWDTAALEQETKDRFLLEPFERLAATSDDGHLRVLIAPVDPQFPRLVRLYEPAYVAAQLASLSHRADPAVFRAPSDLNVDTDLHDVELRTETIRYRPGQRHVLRVSTCPRDGGSAIVKAYRDATGVRALAVAEMWRSLLAATCTSVRPARSLGYVEADRAAWWVAEGGVPLWRLLPNAARATRALTLVGRALRALHDRGPATGALPEPLPHHDAAIEMAATMRAAEHITALLPGSAERFHAVLCRVAEAIERLPVEPPTLTHGDFKCDNLLAAHGEIRLLDLDRAAIAEPALDLGKFLADLRTWCARLGADAGGAIAAFADGYGATSENRLARARALAVLFQLKLAARRIPAHDLAWPGLVAAAVRNAEAASVGLSGGRP